MFQTTYTLKNIKHSYSMTIYLMYLFTIISIGLIGQSISLDNRLQSSRLILGSNANIFEFAGDLATVSLDNICMEEVEDVIVPM